MNPDRTLVAERPAHVALRGTVTMLFTDVEGSTRLLQRYGEQSVQVLEDHKSLLRSAVAEHSGREVAVAGDGFFVVFEVARDAVAAAAETQRRLTGHDWPHGDPVRVRMGVHTGKPILAERKYLGLEVHRAARLCAAGHGGQVLLSATTRQLVANELPAGVGLRDLGEHRLKDLQNPERVWQLVIPGLPSEFPALRAYYAKRGNLPVESTRIVGRESETERLRMMLLDPEVRLVTLTGPGGTGKTRLALHAAADVLSGFEQGVCLVQLAVIDDAALVPSVIARTLGVMVPAAMRPTAAVVEHLREREMLLVLDNFEHVLSAARAVSELLAECPRVKVVATSRIPLNLMLEREFPVPPLAAPDPGRAQNPQRVRLYPAVELFAQRAAAVNPTFRLDGEDAFAVAEICHRLDGLPLAIELAAARVKVFSPRALLARLDRRLELLSSGARDIPTRHRTLRGAIDWSHDLLEDAERALFRRLAVFAGGCTLEAAEAICGAAGPLEKPIVDGIAALVDKSLLRQEAPADGEPRFSMLETIREYALERLAESGEEEATRAAHADHYIAVAERAEPELTGSMQVGWIERIAQEHDNFRAVFRWTADTAHAERALRLGGSLWRYWVVRGYMTEGRRLLRDALSIAGSEALRATRMKVLAGACTMAHEQGDLAEAETLAVENLALAREAADTFAEGRTLTTLAWIAQHGGDHERSRGITLQGLEIHRALNDTRGVALGLNNLGWIANVMGDFRSAREHHEQSLALRVQMGDVRGIAFAHSNLAWAAFRQGRFDEAERLLADALATLHVLGDLQLLGYALALLSHSRLAEARPDEAFALADEAIALAREIGQPWNLAYALTLRGVVRAERGELELARADTDDALTHWRASAYEWGCGIGLQALGDVLRLSGDADGARVAYVESLAPLRRTHARFEIAETLTGLALLTRDPDEALLAVTLLGAAEALRRRMDAPLSARWKPALEDLVLDLRRTLPEHELARAWARGGRLEWQEAVGFAVEHAATPAP